MHESAPSLVLGVAGKVGSGKDTVADLLQLQYGFRSVNLSELVYESNLQLQISPTREQQRTLATDRRRQDGAYWVKFAHNRVVQELPAPGITLVSLYCEDEVDYLKRALGGKLLVVRCDDLAVRYERYVRRYNDDPRRLLLEHEFEILCSLAVDFSRSCLTLRMVACVFPMILSGLPSP